VPGSSHPETTHLLTVTWKKYKRNNVSSINNEKKKKEKEKKKAKVAV